MRQQMSAKLDAKGRETLAYLDECLAWYRTSEEAMAEEKELRSVGAVEIAADIFEDKYDHYSRIMYRRLFINDLIRAADMSPRHKKLMVYRYVKCWKLRTICARMKRTKSWVLNMRLQAIQAMALVFDRVVADDVEYRKPGG